MKPIAPLLVVAALLGSSAVQADVYKCVDPLSGRVTYTNSKEGEKGCTLLSRDQSVTTVPAARRSASASSSPSDFPKVDANAQKSRDSDRRQILETELANEKALLEAAKRDLAEQESQRSGNEKNYERVLERLQPYKDKVDLHERNLAAIRKEIAGLR